MTLAAAVVRETAPTKVTAVMTFLVSATAAAAAVVSAKRPVLGTFQTLTTSPASW